jgi:hypothetical protein
VTEPQVVFDIERARLLKAEGMAHVWVAQGNELWKEKANWFFEQLHFLEEFTADDVTAFAGLPNKGANRNNVIGSWFGALSRKGRIEDTGKRVKSERPARHRNGYNIVWRKLS